MALAERDVAQPNHSRKDPQEIAQRIILSVGPVRDFTDWKPIELHMWTVHRIRGDGWVGYDRLEPLGLTFKMFRKGQNGSAQLTARSAAAVLGVSWRRWPAAERKRPVTGWTVTGRPWRGGGAGWGGYPPWPGGGVWDGA